MCIAAIAGDSIHPRRSLTSHYTHCVGTRQLGALPPADVIQNLGLSVFPTSGGDKQLDSGVGSLASIIPLLTSLPAPPCTISPRLRSAWVPAFLCPCSNAHCHEPAECCFTRPSLWQIAGVHPGPPFCPQPPYLGLLFGTTHIYMYIFDADPLSVASTSCPSPYHLTWRVSLWVLVLPLAGSPTLGSVSEGLV